MNGQTVPTVTLAGSALQGVNPDLLTIPANLVPETVRLGRIRRASKPSVLHFRNYLSVKNAAKPAPKTVDYAAKAAESIRRMYANDRYGDCVPAGKYHAVGIWTGNDNPPTVVADDAEVLSMYRKICGPNDQGCIITDVLDYFKNKGLPFGGKTHSIDGYVAVDWTNPEQVKVALYLFGALCLGINLPGDWTSNAIWDVTNSRIVGGHDVTACGYNDQGVQIASWGRIYTITWAAFTKKVWLEECYAMLAGDWYGDDRMAPSGVDVKTLADDLAKLDHGETPDIPDVPPGPAPVPPTPIPPLPPHPPHPGLTIQLTGKFPHFFGHETVTLTGTAMPMNASAGLHAIPPAVWQVIWALIGKLGPNAFRVMAIVLADLEMGKKWPEIIQDILDQLSTNSPGQ